MNDQERITDLILSEKKMSSNYDTFASECVNVTRRRRKNSLLKFYFTRGGRIWYDTSCEVNIAHENEKKATLVK